MHWRGGDREAWRATGGPGGWRAGKGQEIVAGTAHQGRRGRVGVELLHAHMHTREGDGGGGGAAIGQAENR